MELQFSCKHESSEDAKVHVHIELPSVLWYL